MKYQRRRRLLVDREVQLRFLVIVALASASAVFLATAINAWFLTRAAAELPSDGALLVGQLPGILALNALITLALTVPWLCFVALAGTHRVFGPLVRFRQFLTGVAEGRHPEPCRLRTGDHLQDVCELLNRATEPLRRAQAQAATSTDETEATEAISGSRDRERAA